VTFCGVGVICDGIPFETPVIPAKAGIQSADSAFPRVCRVDSRFRGNDCGFERPCGADETSAHLVVDCGTGQESRQLELPLKFSRQSAVSRRQKAEGGKQMLFILTSES